VRTSLKLRMHVAKKTFYANWTLYLLVLPAFIYLFLFNYMPMYGVQIAFRNFRPKKGITGSDWVGLKHFIKFFNYPNFWKLLGNTLTISLWSMVSFPMSVVLALMINEVQNSKFKRTVQMVTYMPHFISTVVVVALVRLMFARATGVVNTVITGLGGNRIDFLQTPKYFVWLYVGSGIWQNLGWNAIIFLSALSAVSPEHVEAARIDGANRLQINWHVYIPTILPTIIIMLIMRCGSVLSVGYEKIFLMQNPLNLDISQVISTYVYDLGIVNGQYSYSSAIGLFNNVVNIILLLIVNWIAKKVSSISIL